MKIILELKDYVPIDVEFIKEQWYKYMNVPNNVWNELDLDRSLEIINDAKKI